MSYFAVVPASTFDTLENCRIEKATTGADACKAAFGRASVKPALNRGVWLAKNLGNNVRVIQSDNKRIALLRDKAGWFDPYDPQATK